MKLKKIILFGFILFLIIACNGKNVSKMLQKQWVVENVKLSDAVLNTLSKEERESSEEKVNKALRQNKGKMLFDFKPDGTLIVEMPEALDDEKINKSEGFWKLSDDEKTLTINIEGSDELFEIVKLSDTEFRFNLPQEDLEFVLIPKK